MLIKKHFVIENKIALFYIYFFIISVLPDLYFNMFYIYIYIYIYIT